MLTLSEERVQLLHQAIHTWGADAQIDQCIEECAELIVALNHWKRKRLTAGVVSLNESLQISSDLRDDVLEELADVALMLEQMKLVFDFTPIEIQGFANAKLMRVEKRLSS